MSRFSEYLAVVDLETIGRWSNACILSMGVTVSKYSEKDKTFKELVEDGLYLKFDLKEQLQRGRTSDKKTIDWWKEQKPESRKILNPSFDDVSLYDLHDTFVKFFSDKGINPKKVDFYDRKAFDLNKLQYLYEVDLGHDTVPWNYLNEYEVATAFRFLGRDRYGGIKMTDVPEAIYHHALHDAAVDHLRILKCLHEAIESNE